MPTGYYPLKSMTWITLPDLPVFCHRGFQGSTRIDLVFGHSPTKKSPEALLLAWRSWIAQANGTGNLKTINKGMATRMARATSKRSTKGWRQASIQYLALWPLKRVPFRNALADCAQK